MSWAEIEVPLLSSLLCYHQASLLLFKKAGCSCMLLLPALFVTIKFAFDNHEWIHNITRWKSDSVERYIFAGNCARDWYRTDT